MTRTHVLDLALVALLLAGCGSSEYTTVPGGGEAPASTMGQLLQRAVLKQHPGARVDAVDGRIQIRIRGALQEPLFVVDGFPVASGPGGPLWGLNPHDVQHIEVITDPARLARYGMRGANGVVLVTTRR